MKDDIQTAFRDRFMAIARTRVAHVRAAATGESDSALATAVRELHSLAGEAGLLGFSQFVPVARQGEDCAKRMSSERSQASSDAMIAVVQDLERLLAELDAQRPA